MNDYQISDNELIYMINESNESAYQYMYDKYKNLIYKIASKYKYNAGQCGLEFNDLILEGYVAFDVAVKKYKQENNKSKFSNFLQSCIEHSIQNILRNNTNKKNNVLNSAVEYSLINEGEIADINNCEEQQSQKEMYNLMISKLSDSEKEIFKLKIKNYNNSEICILTGKNLKAVNNALSRIRKKLKIELSG